MFRLRTSHVPQNHHLAFGAGAHLCLGAWLARAQARTAIRMLVAGVKRLQLAALLSEVEWHQLPGFRGPKEDPIFFRSFEPVSDGVTRGNTRVEMVWVGRDDYGCPAWLRTSSALQFSERGIAVVVTALELELAQEVVDEIKGLGGTAWAVQLDVTNDASVNRERSPKFNPSRIDWKSSLITLAYLLMTWEVPSKPIWQLYNRRLKLTFLEHEGYVRPSCHS